MTEFYLLHPEKLANWPQDPFHFLGGGPSPSSLKLLDCGVIPVDELHQFYILFLIQSLTSNRFCAIFFNLPCNNL